MILLIDNYDSFTYNLYQFAGELYENINVVRNDEITIDEIENLNPEAIIISPGPGYPKDAGISVEAIRHFSGKLPILGVCLGHQSIAEAFGGKVVVAKEQLHGKATDINLNIGNPLFSGLPQTIKVARYHSLIVDSITLPSCLSVIATDNKAQIMAIRHKEHPTYGVQFHPESIMTDAGRKIIQNFLNGVVGIKTKLNDTITIPDSERTELKNYISKIVSGKHLTEDEAYTAMDIITCDRATPAQTSALLTAMAVRGETIEEMTGFAKVMRQKASRLKNCFNSIDIVGTGGDMSDSFNISTTSSFVIAGAGQKVAKHGNRSASSKSGAADCLEALGVKISTTPDTAEKCINEIGISFLFAQSYHPAMRFVGPVRKQIGVKTVFNIMGPLINPAFAEYMVLGVYSPDIMENMAKVLINLGIKRAMLVYGNDKLDEISISDSTAVCEIKDEKIIKYEMNPNDFGLKLAAKDEIKGGTPKENAQITLDILNGKEHGAKRDIVLFNAGCALYVTGKADTISDGIKLAEKSIDSGAALNKLNSLIKITNAQ